MSNYIYPLQASGWERGLPMDYSLFQGCGLAYPGLKTPSLKICSEAADNFIKVGNFRGRGGKEKTRWTKTIGHFEDLEKYPKGDDISNYDTSCQVMILPTII